MPSGFEYYFCIQILEYSTTALCIGLLSVYEQVKWHVVLLDHWIIKNIIFLVCSIAENIDESIAFTDVGETYGQNSEVKSVGSGTIGPNYIAPIPTGSRDSDFANPESRDWKINSGIAIPSYNWLTLTIRPIWLFRHYFLQRLFHILHIFLFLTHLLFQLFFDATQLHNTVINVRCINTLH